MIALSDQATNQTSDTRHPTDLDIQEEGGGANPQTLNIKQLPLEP